MHLCSSGNLQVGSNPLGNLTKYEKNYSTFSTLADPATKNRQPELKAKEYQASEVSATNTSKTIQTKGTKATKTTKTPVVPIPLRKFVQFSLEENKVSWDIFGNTCRFVCVQESADGRQPNPDNFFIHPTTNEISMRAKEICSTEEHYKAEGSDDEGSNIFALGLTLQFVLTKDERVPLHHCDKNHHELSEEAWELITAVVSEKKCKTFEDLTKFDWWKFKPSKRKAKAVAVLDKLVKSRLREIHEAKSKSK